MRNGLFFSEETRRQSINDVKCVALRECSDFMKWSYNPGDIVKCRHVHATNGLLDVADVMLVSYSSHGFVIVDLEFMDPKQSDILSGISSCTITKLERRGPPLEELLTSNNEKQRKLGTYWAKMLETRQAVEALGEDGWKYFLYEPDRLFLEYYEGENEYELLPIREEYA